VRACQPGAHTRSPTRPSSPAAGYPTRLWPPRPLPCPTALCAEQRIRLFAIVCTHSFCCRRRERDEAHRAAQALRTAHGTGLSTSPKMGREEAAETPAAAQSSQGSPGRVLVPRSDLEFLNRMYGEHPHSQYLSISSSKKRTFLFVRCTHTKCRHPASFHPLHSVMLQERVSARVGAGKTGRRQRGARTRTSSTGTSRSLPMSASNCACSAALADILCLPRRRRSHAPPPPSSGTRALTEAVPS